jgi:16S rRNA (cytosine967-C5)-methyltransferase
MRSKDAYVNPLIEARLREGRLSAEERAFVTRLARGVAATFGELDIILIKNNKRSKLPEPRLRDILRLATYEMAFLRKEPAIVIDQAVELTKSLLPYATGVTNALLRAVAEDLKEFPWGDPSTDVTALAHQQAFPLWLARRLINDLGHEAAVAFMEASNLPAPVYLADLHDLTTLRIESADLSTYRSQRESGAFIVADASAQDVARLALPPRSGPFLEIGSGRGTKTVLLQRAAQRAYGSQTSHYAVEIHAYKHELLRERIARYALTDVTPVTADALALDESIGREGFPSVFSGALIDAPCSNTGTLRRHPEARWRLTPEAISQMAGRGAAMLTALAPHIAPGGFVVYATCSVLKEENEQVIAAFLDSLEGAAFSCCPPGQGAASSCCPPGQGAAFSCCPPGQEFFRSMLTPGSPDAHFAAKLVRSKG